MNIVRENLEKQLELLKITLTPADYSPVVEKALKGYAKQANIPGFRVGKVPMSVIKKMYYKGVLAEESYRMASTEVYNYIQENNIDTIAEPIPSDTQIDLNFEIDNLSDLEFHFKMAVSPVVEIKIEDTELEKLAIQADDAMRADYRENYMRRYAALKEMDVVTSDEAVMADFEQDGTIIEEVYVGLVSMTETERKPFIGAKKGDVLKVSINKLYPDPSARAKALKMTEEEVAKMKATFNVTIQDIKGLGYPEMNEAFFATSFPDGDVKSEEEFNAMLEAQLEGELERESKFSFMSSTRNALMEMANLELPEEFLREWIKLVNKEEFTDEQIEQDFPQYLEMVRWGLIQKKFVKEAEITVSKEEIIEEAKATARMQFAQYGLPNVADDMLERFSNQLLENEQEVRKINEALYESKVMAWIATKAKIVTKNVTVDEFKAIVEAK